MCFLVNRVIKKNYLGQSCILWMGPQDRGARGGLAPISTLISLSENVDTANHTPSLKYFSATGLLRGASRNQEDNEFCPVLVLYAHIFVSEGTDVVR